MRATSLRTQNGWPPEPMHISIPHSPNGLGFLNDDSDGGTFDHIYPSEEGRLVDFGFGYMTMESPYVPVDGEMYWNAGIKSSAVDGHDAAHRCV